MTPEAPVLQPDDAVDRWLTDFEDDPDFDARFDAARRAARPSGPRWWHLSTLALAAAALAVVGLAGWPASDEPSPASDDHHLVIELNRAVVLDEPLQDIDQIAVSETHVAGFTHVTPRHLVGTGWTPGASTLDVQHTDGTTDSWTVEVVDRPLPHGDWIDLPVLGRARLELPGLRGASVVAVEIASVTAAGRDALWLHAAEPGRTDVVLYTDDEVRLLSVEVGGTRHRELDWARPVLQMLVELRVGEQHVVQSDFVPTFVDVTDPEVIQVVPLGAGRVAVEATGPGTSDLTLADDHHVRSLHFVVE